MPPAPREPAIYSGFVISHIGRDAGQRVPMEYKVAQGCVASGTHAWEDDETPLGKNLKAEIEAREAERIAQEEADRAHNEALKQASTKSLEATLRESARPIHFTKDEDGSEYLARPFPKVAIVPMEFVQFAETSGQVFEVSARNAIAQYEVVEETPDGLSVIAVLQETDQFDEEIPSNWRDRHFLANIATAKKIRGLEQSDAMRRPDAEAIIEEWIKTDDQVRADTGTGEEEPRGGEEGKRVKDGEHVEGGDVDSRERAKEAEKEFIEDGD